MALPPHTGDNPRVFVSYAHSTNRHHDWIIRFSTSLWDKGIEAILDVWHLQPGEDRFAFMEKAIASSDFVLLICTPEYAEKANARTGGVGYESMVVTGQLASNLDTNKFIPILRSGDWETAPPVWLRSRIGIDLHDDPYSAAEFAKLLRTLHGQPLTAPAIGNRPEFANAPFERGTDMLTETIRVNSRQHSSLSFKARELLVTAANHPEAEISHNRHLGGEHLFVGDRDFLEKTDKRTKTEWLGALKELELGGLVEPRGGQRYFFPLTAEGYALADLLGDFIRWDVNKLTLSAHYFAGESLTQTFDCSGVVQLPPEYYPDQVAADGAIMTSIKVPASLLIENLDSKLVDSLGWSPTEASFLDPADGKTLIFPLGHTISSPARTTRLMVNLPG
jgi:hypothetical protein